MVHHGLFGTLRKLSLLSLATGVVSTLSLTGCGSDISCDTMAVGSVTVDVTDADGAAVNELAVRFSVDGGSFEDCEELTTNWICGWEQAGSFEIEISAPGFVTQTASTQVEQDTCHVVPQALDIVLEEQECTAEVVPGVILTLVNTDGDPTVLGPENRAWASFGFADTDGKPQHCEPYGTSQFACGWDQSGPFEISAGKIGYYPVFEEVEVAFDGCHPVTESVEITMTSATTPCTEQIEPSVALFAVDNLGAPIAGATANFSPRWEKWFAPEDCPEFATGQFFCGEELTGLLDVEVTAPDYEGWYGEVFVTSDECHVITETAVVTLTPG
jgi:hypothetical protein